MTGYKVTLDSERISRTGSPRRFPSPKDCQSFPWRRWAWVPLVIGIAIVYLRTLAPGVVGGDPGELQFVPAILSIPHPTGTPLYILLGKLWSMLPLGPTVAWRMNLLAAVSASLACLVVYFTVDLHARHPLPALGAAISLAFGLTFWEQALLADKYAFNALMVAMVLYLTLRWGKTRAPGTLNLLALAYGLSLAHHRTMALFAPFLLAYVWILEKGALWRDGRRLLRLAALVLAPLTLYFYLPWAEARNLPPGTWHPGTPREWYDYLFDTGRTGLVYVDPNDLGEMLMFYLRTWVRDFTWAGVALGVGGAIAMVRRRWLDAAFLLCNFVAQAFLAANHHVPRHWVYFIPSFVIYALWVGEGLSALWQGLGWLKPRVGRALGVTLALFLALATLAWPLVPFPGRYRPLRDAHHGVGVLDVWRQTLKRGHMGDRVGRAIANIEPDAVVLCDWEQATPLWYYQQVEGLRPDVTIVYPVERLDEVAASGRPLYMARAQAGLADRWHPSCSDSLIRLRDAPNFELPLSAAPLSARLGPFELAGYAYGAPPGAGRAFFYPGEVVPLTLYWRAVEKPVHDYSVSVRFFDPGGGQVGQVDAQHPVLGTYPTSRWAAGEGVSDYYELQIPPRTAPGEYRWGVILYRALPEGGWESLKVEGTGEEMAMGGTVEVQARP
jgi:hypothetical protein